MEAESKFARGGKDDDDDPSGCRHQSNRVHDNGQLSFASRPFNPWASWEKGIMDICVSYWGQPFAYMVVRNGHFENKVRVDAQWNLRCCKSGECREG
jgi:hypothetical protein